jgi:hypothetical protein
LFYFQGTRTRKPLGVIPLEGALVAAEQLLVPSGRESAPPRALHTLQVALPSGCGGAEELGDAAYLLAAPSPELQVASMGG